eukprot:TRINITY_DN21197_c0_g3_i4.p2 TRINITY_DN21197_c0_g3~~TRINITY_DN21197_c0_g3_i4.p2  ORF type:complete len:101 (+),score=26.37 TRINITY_DN21197_c0_g3_i4:94-396(+)
MACLLLRLLLLGLVGKASSACPDEVSCSQATGTEEASLLALHAKANTCGDTISDDCKSEYNNAMANKDVAAFCRRCFNEGGANPLSTRCRTCCEACAKVR